MIDPPVRAADAAAPPWWSAGTWVPAGTSRRQLVACAAAFLIGLQMVVRGWAVFGAWFYSDDFIFLEEAGRRSITLDFLFTPHDSHLMPVGNLIAWGVAHGGPYNWALAASITLAMQLAAGGACLWMLATLFGWRWRILGPLALYLFWTLSLDGFLWWAAALNALPLHMGFFVAVTGTARYVRSHDRGGLALALAGVTLALLSDPRGMLVPVTLGLVAAGFFTAGTWWLRPVRAAVAWWRLWVPVAALSVAYLVAYRSLTPSPVDTGVTPDVGGTANTMLGTSFATAVLGGPWRWDNGNPPMAVVDPPSALRWIAIVALALVLLAQLRRSPATTTAAVMVLVVHLTVTLLGAALGRATQIGAGAGLLMRFLSDSAPVTALVVALATLPVVGAVLTPRPPTRPPTRRHDVVLVAVVGVVVAGAIFSTVRFAGYWRHYPARTFIDNATASLSRDPATIADVPVPELVQAATAFPHNLPSRLLAPLGTELRTSTAGNDLRILDDTGNHRAAEVPAFITAVPGPRPDCGYLIGPEPTRVELSSRNNAAFWWMTLSYVASGPTQVRLVTEGGTDVMLEIQPGLHTFFLQGEQPFSSLTLSTVGDGPPACVDKLAIGDEIRARQ